MPTTAQCTHCGATLSRPDASFCPTCGRPQQDLQPDMPSNGHSDLPATHVGPAFVASMPSSKLPATRINAPIITTALAARLTVQDGLYTQEYPLSDRRYTLGRAPGNDIICASRFVSAHHAQLDPDGNSHRIIDLGSTNSLLFAGQRLPANQPHALANGDVLRIGDPTTGNFVTLTYHNPQAPATAGVYRQQRYPLDPNEPQITIGREDCDVVLDNPQVSRFHARIDWQADGERLLRDNGSTNGVLVNGQRVRQTHVLRPGDVIQIGPFKLVYTLTSLDQYDQRGALRIDAHHLSRWVTHGNKRRLILKDVSLSIAPREFVALVGSSGTGKSTLLHALSGYVRATSGEVLINGDDYYRNFDAYRTAIGYVPQEDSIHHMLPVKRALTYAALLRLPDDTTRSEIEQRVNTVLADVEMAAHQYKFVDQLSGGQRKRISIGAELLAEPSLFFLDEPASGLDPGLEKKLMYTLRRLADSGRTVVLITHATANIMQCDHVACMSDGRVVYFGPPAEALTFFGITSGDFADIYSKLEGRASPTGAIVQRDLAAEFDTWRATHQSAKQPPRLAVLWEAKFRASDQFQRYVVARLQQVPQSVASKARATQHNRVPRASTLRQFGILTRRYTDLLTQDRRNLAILLLQAPIIGMLLALVAKSDAIVGAGAAQNQAKKVLFMLATVAVWFGIINAAREISKERTIYRRERLANLRIGPYVCSKIAVLTLLVIIQGLILLLVVGLKVTFPTQGIMLPITLELFITTVLTALAGLALGLVISAFAKTPDRATSIVPLALVPQIVFAGLIFDLDGIARPLSWLTISRWAMDAYGSIVNLNTLPAFTETFGKAVPDSRYTHTPRHLLMTWLILLVYGIVCTSMTVLLLKWQDGRKSDE